MIRYYVAEKTNDGRYKLGIAYATLGQLKRENIDTLTVIKDGSNEYRMGDIINQSTMEKRRLPKWT